MTTNNTAVQNPTPAVAPATVPVFNKDGKKTFLKKMEDLCVKLRLLPKYEFKKVASDLLPMFKARHARHQNQTSKDLVTVAETMQKHSKEATELCIVVQNQLRHTMNDIVSQMRKFAKNLPDAEYPAFELVLTRLMADIERTDFYEVLNAMDLPSITPALVSVPAGSKVDAAAAPASAASAPAEVATPAAEKASVTEAAKEVLEKARLDGQKASEDEKIAKEALKAIKEMESLAKKQASLEADNADLRAKIDSLMALAQKSAAPTTPA